MNTDCPHGENAAAFLAHELPPHEHAEFSRHLATCAVCQAGVASTRHLLGRLRAVPAAETARDLAPEILARLHAERRELPRPSLWPRLTAIAAAVALLAGGALLAPWRNSAPSAPPAVAVADEMAPHVSRALDWFCHTQEPDGSWNAEKWGGSSRFAVALTALPTLALLSADVRTPEHEAALARATEWLQKQQDESGAFGPDFQGASYNQGMATLALLHAYERHPNAKLKHTLDAALHSILARQTADGGWGYWHSPFADRSITEWHVEALAVANALGWETARPGLERSKSWLAARPETRPDAAEPADSPSVLLAQTPDGSAEIPALDFYRAYFLSTALRREHDSSSRQRLAAIRQTLLAQQVPAGSDSGSWPPDHRWGRAGGRLYSTALASLSLSEH